WQKGSKKAIARSESRNPRSRKHRPRRRHPSSRSPAWARPPSRPEESLDEASPKRLLGAGRGVALMPIEHVAARAVTKPWGVADPRPWAQPRSDGTSIGELWYERTGADRTPASLLLKLLFTSQPLSIQVHPDDTFA